MFAGLKAALRPIYDNLLELAFGLGKGIRVSPGKTIVPVYRNHVLEQIKPATRTRIDFGLALGDTKVPASLKDTGGLAKGIASPTCSESALPATSTTSRRSGCGRRTSSSRERTDALHCTNFHWCRGRSPIVMFHP
jgi:hypothetical protein